MKIVMLVSQNHKHTTSRYGKFVGAAGAAALFLSACSDGSSSNEEDEPVSIDSAGRLALYDSDDSAVVVYDLDSEFALQRFAMAGGEASLYASPDKRYAVLIQRNDNRVSLWIAVCTPRITSTICTTMPWTRPCSISRCLVSVQPTTVLMKNTV
ncbi:hypothetical protein [Granulosicoccus antarcticus]|uniref:hypothetical protein n=1 Tax=Granulosicoccus antarcticus TaxID=437505 RepID=UPI0012FE469D|nr:hypothetical protein [Granulosicoccus antarcticus]